MARKISFARLKNRIRDGGAKAVAVLKAGAAAAKHFLLYHCRCTKERTLFALYVVLTLHIALARLAAPLVFEWERMIFAIFAISTASMWWWQAIAAFYLASVAYIHVRDAIGAIPEAKAFIKARLQRLRAKIAELRAQYLSVRTQQRQPTTKANRDH